MVVGRLQQPIDYSRLPTATLARQCDVEMFDLSDHDNTIAEYFGICQYNIFGLQLLSSLQSYALHICGAKEDMYFSYLQLLQDASHDLVPNHSKDGEDIKKYFQCTSEVMTLTDP